MHPEYDLPHLLTPTDLKQYVFCPRVLFYERCWPDFRPRTHKMDAGKDAHEYESKLEARRTLGRYKLAQGERFFDVRLCSEKLRLSGIVDEIIRTPTAAYPVDYKLARQPSHQYRVQLAIYGLLIEDQWQIPTPIGYLWLISARRAERVELDNALRSEAIQHLESIQRIINEEMMPPPTPRRSKCRDCEFRRVCNDV